LRFLATGDLPRSEFAGGRFNTSDAAARVDPSDERLERLVGAVNE
jgi:hypothetical protein